MPPARSADIHDRRLHLDERIIPLAGGITQLRQDRILHEAIASGGDTRRLCDMFDLSINTPPADTPTPSTRTSTADQ